MENIPLTVYLTLLEKIDKDYLNIIRYIEDNRSNNKIDTDTYLCIVKKIAKQYNKEIDDALAKYNELRNEERDLEYQEQGY